jgi:hypothetical protein
VVINCHHHHFRYCSSCVDGHVFYIHLCHFSCVGPFMGPVSKRSKPHAFGTQDADAPNLPFCDRVWTRNTKFRWSIMAAFLQMTQSVLAFHFRRIHKVAKGDC